MQDILHRARKIRLAIFDVDGVLTDGSLYLSDSGEEIKAFNTQDGHGLKMLKASGVELGIISGRKSKVVELRARDLGIDHVYQGCADKVVAFEDLLARLEMAPDESAYMGDDIVDLPVMRRAGLAFAVPAAPESVQRHAHYVTRKEGGRGAVREVCELIMQLQDNFEAQVSRYLQ